MCWLYSQLMCGTNEAGIPTSSYFQAHLIASSRSSCLFFDPLYVQNPDTAFKKSCFCGWNLICVSKRRLQDIFDQIEGPICQKIQRNVLVALSTYLSTKRRLSLLNGLSVKLLSSASYCQRKVTILFFDHASCSQS
jgi:hypothetical protein